MISAFRYYFSLATLDAEIASDSRIRRGALDVFVRRETMNSYLAQLVFAMVAVAGLLFGAPSVLAIAILHVSVDQIVRSNLVSLAEGSQQGTVDEQALRRIERLFFAVGAVWAMAAWPLAEGLDGLRLLLTVVSAAGLLVMANTTCHAPRVFRAAVIGYGLTLTAAIPMITIIPWYVLGGGVVALLVVVVATGASTARQLLQMLRVQAERDDAITAQARTIADLDAARKAATVQAETDSLTKLANRFRFLRELDARIAAGERFSLTLFDIDLFKNVNDALGHHIGDQVLKVVGRALAASHADGFFAARLGGDEFALIAPRADEECRGETIFADVERAIAELLSRAVDLPPITITGGSAYFPKDAESRSELLAAADIAQREAKKARRGAHLDFDPNLSDIFWREAQIAQAVSEAIESRALYLCFQPKIDLESGCVVGGEALSRFSSEKLSSHSLDEIFEVAERRGLGTTLDELVLDIYREALISLRDDHGISLPTSVNLSGAILKAPERLLGKLRALANAGLDPALTRVEITENAISGRGQAGVIELLDQIVGLGFSFALDDFGTGSGALRHLVSLPVAEIKIDRSFVAAMDADTKNLAVIRGMIVTGNDMRIDIVAEGVETQEQADMLREMGAQFAQGYLWARPLPFVQFVEFARRFGADAKPARVGSPRTLRVAAAQGAA